MFGPSDLGLPLLTSANRLVFKVPPVTVDRIALVTNLSWSEHLPDGTTVARLIINVADGRVLEFPLRAGVDSSEWAYDRTDIRAVIKHKRAEVAGSYDVQDSKQKYEGHTYVTAVSLPSEVMVSGGELVLEPNVKAPDLSLQLFRLSIADQVNGKNYPLRRDWFTEQREEKIAARPGSDLSSRWHFVSETPDVQIYENRKTLPRAWLTTDARVLTGQQILTTIQSGKLPTDGSEWDPERTALLETDAGFTKSNTSQREVEITTYEPNRIDMQVQFDGPAILVLSENHYPGWRAYVDGASAEVMRVDYNLRGVLVNAGSHQVSFVYRPKSFLVGLAISLLTIVGLIVWSRRG